MKALFLGITFCLVCLVTGKANACNSQGLDVTVRPGPSTTTTVTNPVFGPGGGITTVK